MSLSLYEINKQIAEFSYDIDPETGEILNMEDLDRLNIEKSEKIESLCLWVKSLRAEANAVKDEQTNLGERVKRLTRKADSIERYIGFSLAGDKFSTPKVEVKWSKSERVVIPDEALVPDDYVALSVERKPVKANIKKMLKRLEDSGESCEWASLEVRNNMKIV